MLTPFGPEALRHPASPVSAPHTPPSRRLVKVCGMRDASALAAVAALEPALLGFIFAPHSPRYVGEALAPELVRSLPAGICKVGVFVNETPATMLATARRYGLAAVQLHGGELPATCAALRQAGLLVIKAFAVGAALDLDLLREYVPHCDFFLFDAQGPAPGGNGTTFNWRLLQGYNLPVPYLLAGGLTPGHAAELAALRLPGLAGFDLNSGFETAPGVKDPARVARFLEELRAASASTVSES